MKYTKAVAFLSLLVPMTMADRTLRSGSKSGSRSNIMESSYAESSHESNCIPGAVVVANRGSGGITIFPTDGSQQFDIKMPSARNGGGLPEPMYISVARGKVYVGCRQNSEIVVFDARTYKIINRIPAGEGVFHMWADSGNQLWVVNDIDKTVTAIDTALDKSIKNVDLTGFLDSDGDKPHDIVVTPAGDAVYVTLLSGAVLKIDPSSFKVTEENTANIGGDPHLAATFASDIVFVPQQASGTLSFLDPDDLALEGSVDIPNAHGIGISPSGRYAYIANIGAAAGGDALYTVDVRGLSLKDEIVKTGAGSPHNIVVTNDDRIFITHSSTNKVTEHTIGDDGVPNSNPKVHTAGTTPFGIGYVQGTCQ